MCHIGEKSDSVEKVSKSSDDFASQENGKVPSMPKQPRNSTIQHGTDRHQHTQVTKTVRGVGRRKLGGWWFLAPLLIPAVAAGTTAFSHHTDLEQQLASSSKSALQKSGYDVSSVSFSGRDGNVSLASGDVQRAREIVGAQPGVRVAAVKVGQDTGASQPAASPTASTPSGTAESATQTPSAPASAGSRWDGVTLKRTDEGVVIQATVPSEEAKSALRERVEGELSPAKVVDEIVVSDGVRDADVESIAAAAKELTTPGMVLTGAGDTVTLTGQVADDGTKNSIASSVSATVGSAAKVVNNLTVASGQPTTGSTTPAPANTTPQTPDSSPENAAGDCATVNADVQTLLTQKKIQFELNGTNVAGASRETLKSVADKLKPCIDANASSPLVTVEGHASAEGRADINQRLSQQRADAVRQVLIDHGMSPDSLTAKGFGSSRPVADNGTPEGRNQNRRVEILLTSNNQ